MLNNKIKKVLLETKETKEKLLIEEKLIKSRVMMILESEDNIKNFESLSQSKKEKIAYKLLEEISFFEENKLMNEQLSDALGKIFGNSLSGILKTIVEPMVNSLLGTIGLTGHFKDFTVSYLTSNPTRLSTALKSCDEMTKLVAESLSESLIQMIKNQQGLDGKGHTLLRNALGDAISKIEFRQNIEKQINTIVCDVFEKMTSKASQVYDKLKPEVNNGIGGLIPSAITSSQPK